MKNRLNQKTRASALYLPVLGLFMLAVTPFGLIVIAVGILVHLAHRSSQKSAARYQRDVLRARAYQSRDRAAMRISRGL